MTEERKRELEQLLEEAMEGLVIRSRSRSRVSSSVDVDRYREYLQLLWTFYSPYSLWRPMIFDLEEVSEPAKSKLLSFIKEEFTPFIYEDKILSASRFIQWGVGLPSDEVLERLLKIAIVQGIEEAVLAFDKYVRGTHDGFYQYIVIIKGMTLKSEIEICDGIRLVPAPNPRSQPSSYLPDSIFQEFGMSLGEWSVLIADVFRSPISQRPVPTTIQEYSELVNPIFWNQISKDEGFPIQQYDFHKEFCQVLSLACNHKVEVTHQWKFSAEIEFFQWSNNEGIAYSNSPLGSCTEIGQAQIDEAKCLYEKLVNLDTGVQEKLRIPIDRWIQSKAGRDPVDQMIDLGIALEALYVPERGGDLTYKFSIRAARYLGKDKKCREELLEKFKQIYNCRSDAVHSGKLDKPRKFGKERIPVSDFIDRAQDLCRKSIKKILEDGDIPDWDSLILSGGDEQANS